MVTTVPVRTGARRRVEEDLHGREATGAGCERAIPPDRTAQVAAGEMTIAGLAVSPRWRS